LVCISNYTYYYFLGSNLFLGDLAGLENTKRSGVSEERMAEACSINKSITALKQLINEIATGAKPSFRSEKLTVMLHQALGCGAKKGAKC